MKKWQVVIEAEDASGSLVFEIEAESAEAAKHGVYMGEGECVFSKLDSKMNYGIFSSSVYERVAGGS